MLGYSPEVPTVLDRRRRIPTPSPEKPAAKRSAPSPRYITFADDGKQEDGQEDSDATMQEAEEEVTELRRRDWPPREEAEASFEAVEAEVTELRQRDWAGAPILQQQGSLVLPKRSLMAELQDPLRRTPWWKRREPPARGRSGWAR